MRFSEEDTPWQTLPPWAEFLIDCGFAWANGFPDERRIAVVSMPCESAGAGLVALGAMRYRLARQDANDSISHFQRIERLAAQRNVETLLRHDTMKGRYRLDGKDQWGVWVRREPTNVFDPSNQSGPPRIVVLPSQANAWRFDSEAPMQAVQGAQLPHGRFYEQLIQGAAPPVASNLAQSDSGICLAGRAAGESVSRSVCTAVRFETQDQVADLARLLTVQSWSPGTISRVTFFNSRTGQLDRSTGATRVVVADGDAAFLKVLEAAEFRQSDVVGVVHRAVERDRLESIGIKLAGLEQWYAPDTEVLNHIPPPPTGITVLALRRR